MIYHSADEGQSFHVHYYCCGRQILVFHGNQKVSNLFNWNWPDCRQSHAFSERKEVFEAFMVDLPYVVLSRVLQ